SPLYQWELAQAYEENEQFSNALKAYEKAYDGLAHDSEFLKAYGYFLTEEGRFEKAVTIFESYLKLEPMDEDILMFMERLKSGNVCFSRGEKRFSTMVYRISIIGNI